ncbi:nitronate monooxygenase family protein [Paludibacterium sp. B53371]|uniref:NAD(P)H-dependent flavin oxidoreductase n=1 Tax=Paludibacterium sp. B53371 TaxID=2806263 RepID=UPI00207B3B8D|nr:nitronate monooxygenase [Paludibacterium sp. B53371]
MSPLPNSLNLPIPLIQAPMAGSPTTPALVAAVSQAGALGSLAAGMLGPTAMTQAMQAVRALTDQPFAVNLFVLPPPAPEPTEVERARARLAPFYQRHGLSVPQPDRWCEDFSAQLEAVLADPPAWLSFTFGILSAEQVQRCHRAGSRVIGTATTVAEGLAWQSVGADAVCAQGAEAGGHRGSFLVTGQAGLIGSMALVPQMVDRLSIPVIAAGGVMDGRGIAACLLLGAQAVQMGTAFLLCEESGIDVAWRAALMTAQDDQTRVTRVFSGRAARGLNNAFIEQMSACEDEVPAYPLQNALTAPLRQAAARQGRADEQSLWAGQGVAMARAMPAGALVRRLDAEWRALLPGWSARRAQNGSV